MPFGIIDTTYVDLPVGIDASYVRNLETRSGLSVAEMVRAVDAAMSTVNQGADPLVADLTYVTPSPIGGTRAIGTKKVTRAGQYTFARPQYVERAGHMLPIHKIDMDLGFTEDGLEEITNDAFQDELDAMVLGFQRYYTASVLDRLFSISEVRVDRATDVVSPGFAGSGSGTNVFTGQYPDGTDLGGGYTHYSYATTDAAIITWIDAAIAKLEKWQEGPFDLIMSPTSLTAFVAAAATASKPVIFSGTPLVRQASTEAEAQVDAEKYVGVYGGKVRLRFGTQGFGDDHFALVKTYGPFDARNPVAWRYDEMKGRNAFVRSRALYPLADAIALQWLGFGIGNRTTAALLYRHSGASAYVNPTITIV